MLPIVQIGGETGVGCIPGCVLSAPDAEDSPAHKLHKEFTEGASSLQARFTTGPDADGALGSEQMSGDHIWAQQCARTRSVDNGVHGPSDGWNPCPGAVRSGPTVPVGPFRSRPPLAYCCS